MLDTLVAPKKIDNDSNDDSLFHFYCCDPNVALCGRDLSETDEIEFDLNDEDICIVCDDLDASTCPKCGRK